MSGRLTSGTTQRSGTPGGASEAGDGVDAAVRDFSLPPLDQGPQARHSLLFESRGRPVAILDAARGLRAEVGAPSGPDPVVAGERHQQGGLEPERRGGGLLEVALGLRRTRQVDHLELPGARVLAQVPHKDRGRGDVGAVEHACRRRFAEQDDTARRRGRSRETAALVVPGKDGGREARRDGRGRHGRRGEGARLQAPEAVQAR